jgi:hypothetical protein
MFSGTTRACVTPRVWRIVEVCGEAFLATYLVDMVEFEMFEK